MSGVSISLIAYLLTIVISFLVAVIIEVIVLSIHKHGSKMVEEVNNNIKNSDNNDIAAAIIVAKYRG